MKPYPPSPVLAVVIIATQLLGPTALWAAEQRGIRVEANRQIVVSALSGDQLTLQRETGSSPLQFREVLAEGARVTTGAGTTAELLIGNRAVVTLGNGTTVQVRTVSADQITIHVTNGAVRVAAAASAVGPQGVVIVQTPSGQVQTRGGIVRVLVEAPVGKTESVPGGEAKPYRATYTLDRQIAAASLQGEVVHVEEGAAEILAAGEKPVTIQAGQRVALQAGNAGVIGEGVKPDHLRPGVVATLGHNQTPKEGREYLVALQVDQATKLGKVITGAAETDSSDSEKKSDGKNVINGATGGVTLTGNSNLVSTLFGNGSANNPSSANIDQNRTGAGYGGNNSNGFIENSASTTTSVNDKKSLLVFTRGDSVEAFVKEFIEFDSDNGKVSYNANDHCDLECFTFHFGQTDPPASGNVGFRPASSQKSQVTVAKELVLVGGSQNAGHSGDAPTETLIVRGVRATNISQSNPQGDPLFPHDGDISDPLGSVPSEIVSANSTFVVKRSPVIVEIGNNENPDDNVEALAGGTLGRFSRLPDGVEVLNDKGVTERSGIAIKGGKVGDGGLRSFGGSFVDAAITATTDSTDPTRRSITLTGGASLDQQTTATIGTTAATDAYFKDLTTNLGRTFSGSLLSVIDGPNGRTSLTMQDRMLGVYDGSSIDIGKDPADSTKLLNVALLSVLDAKLKGPSGSIPLIDIAAGTHFDRDGKPTPEKNAPNVTVTSALVTRSTIPLDGALLEASAPLFAFTKANMTTTSHFADLAGDASQSMNLNGALVALSAADLVVKGNLLNLSSATAAITGYLFSLNNGSTLNISGGSLFKLDNSALTLTGNAFGVFGTGTNTLTIQNNLCGAGAACGALVNSANQPILHEGVPLKVAGVTQNVVLPNGFNAFALAPGGTAANANIDISPNGALFQVDPTSSLTINGAKVK